MDEICYLNIIPEEIIKYIISLTENKVYDLCLVNQYFDNNCKIIKIVDNNKYPKITNHKLKILINLTSLNLGSKDNIITNEGIKELTNIKFLNLFDNNKITDDGIKGLINLSSLNLLLSNKITDDGVRGLTNLTYLYLYDNNIITNQGIKVLTNLKKLNM